MRHSEQVSEVLAAEYISEEEFDRMFKLSSLVRNEFASRRFHHWGFQVRYEGSEPFVERMVYLIKTHVGNGTSDMAEECPECLGDGCKFCGYHGEIIRQL